MTLEEVAIRLGKSPNTIARNFERTKKTLEKKGIILIRIDKDNYEIEYMTPEQMEDKGA